MYRVPAAAFGGFAAWRARCSRAVGCEPPDPRDKRNSGDSPSPGRLSRISLVRPAGGSVSTHSTAPRGGTKPAGPIARSCAPEQSGLLEAGSQILARRGKGSQRRRLHAVRWEPGGPSSPIARNLPPLSVAIVTPLPGEGL